MSQVAKRILLTSDVEAIYRDKEAGGTIKPGHLVAVNSSGKFVVHPTADGFGLKRFALEDAYQGKTVSDAYSSGDICFTAVVPAGAPVMAILTTSQTIVVGDPLASNGDGTLKKATVDGTTQEIIAYAEEAVTTTAAESFIQVQVG